MLLELDVMAQDSIEVLPRRKWWLAPLAIIVVVALAGIATFWAYRATEPDRLCKRARVYLDAGDYRNAAMALRRAITLSPRHQTAARMMVELTERIGSPSVVAWREHLVELNPASVSDRENWAAAAIRVRNIEAAETALAGAPESFRSSAAYEALRGMVAIGKGKWKEAEAGFAEAHRRDPAEVSHQLNHAIAQVQNPDEKVRARGIETLTGIAAGTSKYANAARRALVNASARARKSAEALRWSNELAASGEATMEDLLTNLDLVGWLEKEKFPVAAERARLQAVKSPEDLAAMLFWCARRSMAPQFKEWVESLEETKRQDPKAIEGYAEFIAAMNDWNGLAALTAPRRPWARGDAMRCAFATLAADKLSNPEAASNYWHLAVQAVAGQRDGAMELAYFAHRAQWRSRMMEVLWSAVDGQDPEWAIRMLHPLCAEEGDTPGLLRLAKKLLMIHPNDIGARNNVIQLGLLVGEPVDPLLHSAKELHAKNPNDPVIASTLAYALHMAGNNSEALAVLVRLPIADLRNPSIATYHAVILAANGQGQASKSAAQEARKGKLLPEEEKLLQGIDR